MNTDHEAAAKEIFATMVRCVDAFAMMINCSQKTGTTVTIEGDDKLFIDAADAVSEALDTYSKYEKQYGTSVRD